MSLKIQYASDLHLEFQTNKRFLRMNPLQPVADILVLAGDLVPFAIMEKHKDFFSCISDHFKTTYWLPGNHEYYHFDIAKKSGVLHENIRANVFLVNNTYAVHENTKLIFTTLWSKISAGHQWQIERSMSDFRAIKHNGFHLTADDYNQLHEDSLSFLQKEIDVTSQEKKAVFTHHCPTFLNYPAQFKGDVLNEAFATELFDFIEKSNIDYWVYGHHHTNTPTFTIGKTKLLTNQLGYVQLGEHLTFQRDKYLLL